MYFRCNNGGWNKTHEQVEQMPRIDSFELKHTHAWGGIFCGGKYLDIYQDNDLCEIFPPKRIQNQAIPQSQRLRRATDLFSLPWMRRESALSVCGRAERLLVPEMCKAELQKPAADKGQHG